MSYTIRHRHVQNPIPNHIPLPKSVARPTVTKLLNPRDNGSLYLVVRSPQDVRIAVHNIWYNKQFIQLLYYVSQKDQARGTQQSQQITLQGLRLSDDSSFGGANHLERSRLPPNFALTGRQRSCSSKVQPTHTHVFTAARSNTCQMYPPK